MRRKIIFIDVDGPLAWGSWGDGKVTIDEGMMNEFTIPYHWDKADCEALVKILDESNAKLVLSSDWRKHFSFLQMRKIFAHYGIHPHHLIDITTHHDLWMKLSRPGIDWERAAEIVKWVKITKSVIGLLLMT